MEDYEYTVKVDEKNRMLNDETNVVKVNEKTTMLNDDDDNHILEIYLSQCVPYIIKSSIVNYLCVYLRP
jgi:hypothetical protein